MKKILLLILPALILSGLALATPSKPRLYLLNWGEYIDPDVLTQFEEKYDCVVYEETVSSSESMYQKISDGKTKYDVAIPGDYVVEKLYKKNLIEKLDTDKLTNYEYGIFNDDLEALRLNSTFPESYLYTMPYFWGAYAIVYRTDSDVEYIEEVVIKNGYNALFDRTLYGEHENDVKIGMYDVARYGITAYLLTIGEDINTTDYEILESAIEVMRNARYNRWGTDELKKDVLNKNLDVFLTQLGDFFDQYYVCDRDGKEVNFNFYIPDNTAAFYDGMVIPTISQNKDLAYKFVDFMLDPDIAFQNAQYVGYSPTLKSVAESYVDSCTVNPSDYLDEEELALAIESAEWQKNFLETYPLFLNPILGKTATLFADLGNEYASKLTWIKNKIKE